MKQRGVTLTEVVIGVLIGSLVLLGATTLFSSGVRIFRKGTSHLTNAQAASILLAQIEQDLTMATRIDPPPAGGNELHLWLAELSEESGKLATSTVGYTLAPDALGVRRAFSAGDAGGGAPPLEHVFCRGLRVGLTFRPIGAAGPPPRLGFLVEVTVQAPGGSEENRFQRFVYCSNLPANRGFQTGDWRW